MNGKKIISIFILTCFLLSFVFGEGIAAVLDASRSADALRKTLEGSVIPAGTGMISAVRYGTGSKVLVTIQDLHCHSEVQCNIARLLKALDERCGLRRVYVEGAAGRLDTSWLGAIKDDRLRTEAVEALLDQGKLTGSEYYSIRSGKYDLLWGLENEKVYRENIARLGRIMANAGRYDDAMAQFRKELSVLKSRYCSSGSMRFDALVEKHRQGKTDGVKYYRHLMKYAAGLERQAARQGNIARLDPSAYRNIAGFVELGGTGRQLRYGNISRQLQLLMQELKQRLPYSMYDALRVRTDNFSRTDELCSCLSKLVAAREINLDGRYPDLKALFDYTARSGRLDPLALLKEERRLVAAVRAGLAGTKEELEVAFITDFLNYFDDFLHNRLTADDYDYFSGNFGEFKAAWARYVSPDLLSELEPDCALLEEFYRVNVVRNDHFMERLQEELGAGQPAEKAETNTGSCQSAEQLLGAGKELIVVVTGGFHTGGLSQLFDKSGCSYITITPNVTTGTGRSDEVYAELVRHYARVAAATIPPPEVTGESGLDQLETTLGTLLQKRIAEAAVSQSSLVRRLTGNHADKELLQRAMRTVADELEKKSSWKVTPVTAAGSNDGRRYELSFETTEADGTRQRTVFDYYPADGTVKFSDAGTPSAVAEPVLRAASMADKKLKEWGIDRDHPSIYAFYTTVIAPIWESIIHAPVLAVLMYFSGPWAYLAAVGVNIVISWGFATVHDTATKKEWNTLFVAGLAFGGIYYLLPVMGIQLGWYAVSLSMGIHSFYNILALRFNWRVASIVGTGERVAGGGFRSLSEWREFRKLNVAKPADELARAFAQQVQAEPGLTADIVKSPDDGRDYAGVIYYGIDSGIVDELDLPAKRRFYSLIRTIPGDKGTAYLIKALRRENDVTTRQTLAREVEKRYSTANARKMLEAVYPDKADSIAKLFALVPHGGDMPADEFSRSVFVQEDGLTIMLDQLVPASKYFSEKEVKENMKGWRKLTDIAVPFPFEWREPFVMVQGYALPHVLELSGIPETDASGKNEVKEPGEQKGFVTIKMSPVDTEIQAKLKRKFISFQTDLIDSNFAALELISSHSVSLDKGTAVKIIEYLEAMIGFLEKMEIDFAYEKGTSAIAYEVAQLRNDLKRRKDNIAKEMNALGNNALLSEAVHKKITDADYPDGIPTIQELIKEAHALGYDALEILSKKGYSDLSVTIGKSEIDLSNLGERPIMVNGEIVSRPLALFLKIVEPDLPYQIKTLADKNPVLILVDDYLFWSYNLGKHRVEVTTNVNDPDDGGFLRIRYFEGDKNLGNKLRKDYLQEIFSNFGIPLTVIQDGVGAYMIKGMLDKDHGATGRAQIEATTGLVIKTLLFGTSNIDLSLDTYWFKNIYDKKDPSRIKMYGYKRAANMALKWARVLVGEGGLPFTLKGRNTDSHLLPEKYKEYRKKAKVRKIMRDELNRLLSGWGFPKIPGDVHFGQRVIDDYYTRPVTEALARGELKYNERRMPEKNPQYDPVVRLVDYIESDTKKALRTATTLNTFPEDILRYEPVGYAGQLSVVRGQFRVENGAWVIVNGAMDPVTRNLMYAEAFIRQKDEELRTVTAGELVDLLNANGLNVEIGFEPNEAQSAIVKRMLESSLPLPGEGAREIPGIAASPGERRWTAGKVTFDLDALKNGRRKGNTILVVPYTTPDDIQAIENADGVITTSGGFLSHAALVTRERKKPAVIIWRAVWEQLAGEKLLKITVFGPGGIERHASGINISRSVVREDLVLQEGDVAALNGREGIVNVYRQESQPLLQQALALLNELAESRLGKPRRFRELLGKTAGIDVKAQTDALEVMLLELSQNAALRARGVEDIVRSTLHNMADRNEFLQTVKDRFSAVEARLTGLPQEEGSADQEPVVNERTGTALPFKKLLFVCNGNTYRSAMSQRLMEYLLKKKGISGITVASRGLNASLNKVPMRNEAVQAVEEYTGQPVERTTGQQLTLQDVQNADAIFAMERWQVEEIEEEFHAEGKVFLLGDFVPDKADRGVILDPYEYGPWVYAKVHRQIIGAMENIAGRLRSGPRREVIRLSELGRAQTGAAGGKAAHLGEIAEAVRQKGGYVPEGLAITTDAFDRFLKEAGLKEKFDRLTGELDKMQKMHGINRAIAKLYSDQIRSLILSASFNTGEGSLGNMILSGIDEAGLDAVSLAVRSSAVQEDTEQAAFAGGADSYLFVTRAELLEEIKDTWASFYLQRGIEYRAMHRIPQSDVRPAAVVQQMVDAAVAGVAFSEDPVTGDENEVLIEAAYGLGDTVVSGKERSDIYRARKSDGSETTMPVTGYKHMQVVPRSDGSGVQHVPVNRFLRKRRALSPDEVKKVSNIVVALEQHLGYPVDVEFAIDKDGKIAVLQTRPITTGIQQNSAMQQEQVYGGVMRWLQDRYVERKTERWVKEGDSGKRLPAETASLTELQRQWRDEYARDVASWLETVVSFTGGGVLAGVLAGATLATGGAVGVPAFIEMAYFLSWPVFVMGHYVRGKSGEISSAVNRELALRIALVSTLIGFPIFGLAGLNSIQAVVLLFGAAVLVHQHFLRAADEAERYVLPLTVLRGTARLLKRVLRFLEAVGDFQNRDIAIPGEYFSADRILPLQPGAAPLKKKELKKITWNSGHAMRRAFRAQHEKDLRLMPLYTGEARRRQLPEKLAKGKELVIGLKLGRVKGHEEALIALAKATGTGNIRLREISAGDELDRTAAALRKADLKVLRDLKLGKNSDPAAVQEEVLASLAVAGKPAGVKTVFDGIEIDATESPWPQEQFVAWLNGISRERPEARITVVLPEAVNADEFRKLLEGNIAIVEEGQGRDGSSYVRIRAEGGLDLPAALRKVTQLAGASFEISFEGDALQMATVKELVNGLLERINESPAMVYDAARAAEPAPGSEVYRDIRNIVKTMGLAVEGNDFAAAVAEKDLARFFAVVKQLTETKGAASTLLRTKALQYLEEANKAGTTESKQRAAAKLAALLKGSGEAILVDRYLELKDRSGFEKDADRFAFGATLWAMDGVADGFLAKAEGGMAAPEEARLTGDADIDLLAQYLRTGAAGAQISGVLNKLRARVTMMPGHKATIYAMAYAKYGEFSYFNTLTVIDEARRRVQQAPGETSLIDTFRILELLSDEKLRLDRKMKPETGINVQTIGALLGAA